MINPKQQAKDLVDKFIPYAKSTIDIDKLTGSGQFKDLLYSSALENAKQSALICVEEIITSMYELKGAYKKYNYWQLVKEEIQNIKL